MVLFSLRKRSFNGLLAPCVEPFSLWRIRKGHDAIQSILPYMSCHHPAFRGLTKACFSSAASSARLAVAEVLPVSLARCGFPIQPMFLRADVHVVFPVELESVFSVALCLVRMPPVSNDALYPVFLQQMRSLCVVISGVQTHVHGQMPKPLFNFPEDLRQRRGIVDIGRLNMHVDDDVMFAVHGTVLTVIKSIRLPISVLLSALRVRQARHPRLPAALGR